MSEPKNNQNILTDNNNNKNNSNPLKENDQVTVLTKKMTLMNMKTENNKVISTYNDDKENLVPKKIIISPKAKGGEKLWENKVRGSATLKPSSLQLCIQQNEPDSSFGSGFGFGSKMWDCKETVDDDQKDRSGSIWQFSDSDAAPVSSWSTLPNRALLCRALPVDVGRCTCFIKKEAAPPALGDDSLYCLYTNEGEGRQNRKLAVAYHKRRNGRSTFIVAQNKKGLLCTLDDSFLGVVTGNIMGSKYFIWYQDRSKRNMSEDSNEPKQLQGVIEFVPTITTWTGSCRSIKAWIPKHQPGEIMNVEHAKKLPWQLEEQRDQVYLLRSKVPQYNKLSKQYELDFREKVRAGFEVQPSVKNFQLAMEGNERQTVVQLGRVGSSEYVLDYRYPVTGYQAFCICLASIDPKLCCTV